jgi:hypothetical protein
MIFLSIPFVRHEKDLHRGAMKVLQLPLHPALSSVMTNAVPAVAGATPLRNQIGEREFA